MLEKQKQKRDLHPLVMASNPVSTETSNAPFLRPSRARWVSSAFMSYQYIYICNNIVFSQGQAVQGTSLIYCFFVTSTPSLTENRNSSFQLAFFKIVAALMLEGFGVWTS